MALIIATTDFSGTANNALQYACNMALANNADVLVIHCYSVPVSLGDLTIPMPVSEFKLNAEETMENHIARLHSDFPQLSIKSEVIYGNVVDAVNDLKNVHGHPLLVIAGNEYAGVKSSWMDSTLMDAFRKMKYPTLAIPPETKYTQVRKIGFACDNNFEGSEDAITKLKDLSLLIGAELHILYAQKDVHTNDNESDINSKIKDLLTPAHPMYHYEYEENIDDAIVNFAAKYHLDWLSIMPREHSFLTNLFRKSHSKALISNSFIPVLALHES